MAKKILKISVKGVVNCKIHPVLYHFFLRLKDTLDAELVHRRKRKSTMSVEVIYHTEEKYIMTGRLNSLPEAEECGFWVINRRQNKKGHLFYKEHRVYQLYLSPVHPKKRREQGTTFTYLSPSSSSSSELVYG